MSWTYTVENNNGSTNSVLIIPKLPLIVPHFLTIDMSMLFARVAQLMLLLIIITIIIINIFVKCHKVITLRVTGCSRFCVLVKGPTN